MLLICGASQRRAQFVACVTLLAGCGDRDNYAAHRAERSKPKTEAEKQAAHSAEVEAVKSALTAKSIEFTAEATLDELKKLLDEAK